MFPGWKMMKIHFIFGSKLSLRTYPRAYPKMMENDENPLYFRIQAFPEDLSQGISQNFLKKTSFSCSPGWKTLKIHIIFDSGLSLRSYPKAYLKIPENITFDAELRFSKTLHFHVPERVNQGVENVENPHHFRIRAFPEDFSQGILQNAVWNLIQPGNITFDVELRFSKTLHFHVPEGGKH
ncbi:hypothetical protein E2320_022951 [Naja naja]|nr:hypothetical protein E2320_022951 [Naja naja]